MKLLTLAQAHAAIKKKHPDYSEWMLREDVRRGKLKNVRRRETKTKLGVIHLEANEVNKYNPYAGLNIGMDGKRRINPNKNRKLT